MPNNKSQRHRGNERRIRIRSQLRHQPDLPKIANTVVALALAQAEKEAQHEAEVVRQEKPHAEA